MFSCFIEFIKRVDERRSNVRLASILSRFCNELNTLNNTGARMFMFYLSYDIRITLKSDFWRHKKL